MTIPCAHHGGVFFLTSCTGVIVESVPEMQASVRCRPNGNSNNTAANQRGSVVATAVAAAQPSTIFTSRSSGGAGCGNICRRLGAAAMIVSSFPSSYAFGLVTFAATGSGSLTARGSTSNLMARVARSSNRKFQQSNWIGGSWDASSAAHRSRWRAYGTNLGTLPSAIKCKNIVRTGRIRGGHPVLVRGVSHVLSSFGNSRHLVDDASIRNCLIGRCHVVGSRPVGVLFSTTRDVPPSTAPSTPSTDSTTLQPKARAGTMDKGTKANKKNGSAVTEDTPVAELRTVNIPCSLTPLIHPRGFSTTAVWGFLLRDKCTYSAAVISTSSVKLQACARNTLSRDLIMR